MSRTVTINYEVFNYNELSAEAKENVKRWILEDDFRCYDFETMTNEDLKNLFNADLKVQFSLSYCQGDGLNIYGNVSAEDIFNCLDKHNAGEQLKRFEDYLTEKEARTILAYQNVCSNIELKRNNHYAYSLVDYIDIVENWLDELQDAGYKNINVDVLKKFEKMVKGIFSTLCKDYEKNGYNYFYTMDDEEAEELCDINGWEFDINGKFFAA